MSVQSEFSNLAGDRLEKVIASAQMGHNEAITEIYEAYFLRVYKFIFYRVSHKETAEDLTEEVFVKVFSGISRLSEAKAFEGWLFQIARNLVIDYYRKKKQIVPLDAVENTLEYDTNVVDIVNLQFEQSILIKLLKELTDEQQSVIKLKFLDELDNATIAHILNKSEGAIRVIQHRALIRLKELFKESIKSD